MAPLTITDHEQSIIRHLIALVQEDGKKMDSEKLRAAVGIPSKNNASQKWFQFKKKFVTTSEAGEDVGSGNNDEGAVAETKTTPKRKKSTKEAVTGSAKKKVKKSEVVAPAQDSNGDDEDDGDELAVAEESD